MKADLLVLENPVLPYAWGSRTAIALFLGRTPGSGPEAELWIGAHPKAPSLVVEPPGRMALDAAIGEDPVSVLGKDVCDRFGNELPFLFKVLAAAEPLSIQAHPNQDQARRGWARENAEGIPLDAPHRNYRDPNHKPELVCALSPAFGPSTRSRGGSTSWQETRSDRRPAAPPASAAPARSAPSSRAS
jgi:mannose-6-phosphate isomerase